MKQIPGQQDIFTYVEKLNGPSMLCSPCICNRCLYWWSARCPYGECWDDHRAAMEPYDKAHPDQPPRTGWSSWRTDQAYWCRGGAFYPVHYCGHFVRYRGQMVKECLDANVSVFQDGYIMCSLVDTVGCQECYRRFMEKNDE